MAGKDIILDWILEVLDSTADLNVSSCMTLPRLEAYIAVVLAEPKHFKVIWVFNFKYTVNSGSSKGCLPKEDSCFR